MTTLLIAIFGGLGGICRYFLGMMIPNILEFPFATLFINILGSFCLPIWNNYWGLKVGKPWKLAVGTGFIGAFTTFSGMIIDILKMYLTNNFNGLIIYIVTSIVLGLSASLLGMKLVTLVKKEAN